MFCVLSRYTTYGLGQTTASVAIARPRDPYDYGYISELHAPTPDGHMKSGEDWTRETVRQTARDMLLSKLGDEEKLGEVLDRVTAAEGRDLEWTTVVAAAIFAVDRTPGKVVLD